ncbi:hypothetical protein [Thalassoglobus sp.]|uniref:hypothetical protein n=1 Tax=Thalassoglobus sp. TaxID=2795869 RepID=UPI003AA7D222
MSNALHQLNHSAPRDSPEHQVENAKIIEGRAAFSEFPLQPPSTQISAKLHQSSWISEANGEPSPPWKSNFSLYVLSLGEQSLKSSKATFKDRISNENPLQLKPFIQKDLEHLNLHQHRLVRENESNNACCSDIKIYPARQPGSDWKVVEIWNELLSFTQKPGRILHLSTASFVEDPPITSHLLGCGRALLTYVEY